MGIVDKVKSFLAGEKVFTDLPGKKPAVDKDLLLGKIKQSTLFADLPAENLSEMFDHMETVTYRSGDAILTQGEEGDYYYLLVDGTAKVTRLHPETGSVEVLAEFHEPVGFGEDALISNAKRNATIVMTSDGTAMRLSKDAFNDYVKEPLIDWLSPVQAQKRIHGGAKWLDVREEEEARRSRLHGAISIPLAVLRERIGELDREQDYICYCQNGRQSSTANFILALRGFRAAVLRGGVQNLPRAGGA